MSFNHIIKHKNFNILFTTPSHSQKFCIFNKFRNFYKFDISETETHAPEEMLKQAEVNAAKIYSVYKTKFLTNGSTSGILAAVLASVNVGDKVLIWKNAHRCHHNALRLAGAIPVYYDLPISEEFGVPIGFNNFEQYLNSDIKALIVTSPSYEGYASDIKQIKQACDKFGIYLIVDEAHGALYPFSSELPESAVNYADFTVQSLHKTAGGLNPTALLHVNCESDIDTALGLISTTSPSYPLLLTIEKNINYLNSQKGRKEISKLINNLKEFRKNVSNIEFGGDDITKILIKKDGYTGYELSDKLYSLGIEDEKTNSVSTMLLTGIGTKKSKLKKLEIALNKI